MPVASHPPQKNLWPLHAQFPHTRARLAPWLPPACAADMQVLLRLLKQVTANSLGIEVDKPTLDYVAQLATLLFNSQNREPAAWQDAIVPYLAPFFGDEGAEGVCSACLGRCVGWTHRPVCGVPQTSSLFQLMCGCHKTGQHFAGSLFFSCTLGPSAPALVAHSGCTFCPFPPKPCPLPSKTPHRASQLIDAPEDTDGWDLDASEAGAEELCNCRFSLAYGGKILLNSATLRLVRCDQGLGGRHGLGFFMLWQG